MTLSLLSTCSWCVVSAYTLLALWLSLLSTCSWCVVSAYTLLAQWLSLLSTCSWCVGERIHFIGSMTLSPLHSKQKLWVGMGTKNQSFFGLLRKLVNTGLSISSRTNDSYRYLHCFISLYFHVNDELEAAAWHFPSLNDVAEVCLACMRYSCAVCVCVQSVAARVKHSKWELMLQTKRQRQMQYMQ